MGPNDQNYFDLPDDEVMGMSAPNPVDTPPAGKSPEELAAEQAA